MQSQRAGRYVLGAGVACLGVTVWLLTVATTIWQFGLALGLREWWGRVPQSVPSPAL